MYILSHCLNDCSHLLALNIKKITLLGGGDVKIANQKLDWKAGSKVGSIDNIKHRPGGGNIKVGK